MTSWRWQDGSGSFTDSNHWTDGSPDDIGHPGAGDDALIDTAVTVTAGGQTVKLLTLDGGAIVKGGLSATTIQGAGLSGTLEEGTYTATTVDSITFASGALTAVTMNAGTLAGGEVDAGTLSNFNITGADVTADSIGGFGGGISDGSLGVDALVLTQNIDLEITGGTVTVTTLDISGTDGTDEVDIGGSGTMTVTGSASIASDWGSITVHAGGTLDFQRGFTLTADGIDFEGSLVASGGTVTAEGPVIVDMADSHDNGSGLLVEGGTMTFTDAVTIGQTQEGDLDISDGGKVSVKTLVAGEHEDSSGDIDVRGKDSTLTATGTVTLGARGGGSLSMEESGAAHFHALVIGTESDGDGSVSMYAGTALTVTKTITIGEKGMGSVGVYGGAKFNGGDVIVAGKGAPVDESGDGPKDPDTGFHTEISGSMSVETGSKMTIDALTLGEVGYAEALIDGGTLTVKGESIIAKEETSEGQILVNDGTWDARSGLTVASAGKARVDVETGGTLTVTGDGTLADEQGSDGQAFVDGGDWEEHGDLTVGSAGKARVAVGDGGVLAVDGDLTLGEAEGGSGQIALGDGSAGEGPGELTIGGDLTIGGSGSGTLVSDLSTLRMNGATITLGEQKASKGTLILHGGALAFGGKIVVGDAGKGTLIFNQSATLDAAPGNHMADLTLGEQVGATGTVVFDGKDTTATIGSLEDGALGKGSLKITGGATLTAVSADLATRVITNANGVTVDSSSTFIVTTDLSVGEKGVGTLSVKGAGQATVSGGVTIGEKAGSIGSATISGAVTDPKTHETTSSGLAYGTLTVGEAGSGTLNIDKQAVVVQNKGGDGSVEIAADKGSIGKATVTDKGSSLTGDSLAVGGTEEKAGGKGSLSVSSDAQATFNTVTIWKSGGLTLNGGTLHVTSDIVGNGAITIGKAGTLILNGEDKTVGISFAASSKGAELDLASADLLHAAVKGFAQGDSIAIDGLDNQAAISVATKGANTVVTITDHGKDAGSLTFAGHYAKGTMHLSASGVLTTTAKQASSAKADATGDPSDGASGSDRLHHATGSEVLDASPYGEMPDGEAETGHGHLFPGKNGGDLRHDSDSGLVADMMHFATLAAHLHLAVDFFVI